MELNSDFRVRLINMSLDESISLGTVPLSTVPAWLISAHNLITLSMTVHCCLSLSKHGVIEEIFGMQHPKEVFVPELTIKIPLLLPRSFPFASPSIFTQLSKRIQLGTAAFNNPNSDWILTKAAHYHVNWSACKDWPFWLFAFSCQEMLAEPLAPSGLSPSPARLFWLSANRHQKRTP